MPKWQSALKLLVFHNKQNLIRIRYDWGRELVVISSTCILLSLFYYIFHDFLHSKLQDFPEQLGIALSNKLMGAAILILGIFVAGRLRALFFLNPSWGHFAERIGENPRIVSWFRCLQALLIVCLSYGIFWQFVAPAFSHWDLKQSLYMQALSLSLCGLSIFIARNKSSDHIAKKLRPILNDALTTRRRTLRAWRWYQILNRNRYCRLCIGLSLSIQVGVGIMYALHWPFFLSVLSSMLASALLAWSIAFQLEEDMRAIWLEKQLGCSHEEFVAVYQELGWGLGLILGILSLFIALVMGVPAWVPVTECLKLLAISALFPALMPSIMFQVAPERPLLQILSSSLIGLFLGTAIYAQGLAVIFVALAIHYAKDYQKDNFYRS